MLVALVYWEITGEPLVAVSAAQRALVPSHSRPPLVGGRWSLSYLVDPASSHMLVSKIKPCMSKYKHLYCETANGSLNQLSFIWLYFYYMDTCGNSRANTCEKSRLLEGMYLLDIQTNRFGVLRWLIITLRIVCFWRRWFIQISALSAFDGRVLAYHGVNG